jgi:hypothetical protein
MKSARRKRARRGGEADENDGEAGAQISNWLWAESADRADSALRGGRGKISLNRDVREMTLRLAGGASSNSSNSSNSKRAEELWLWSTTANCSV